MESKLKDDLKEITELTKSEIILAKRVRSHLKVSLAAYKIMEKRRVEKISREFAHPAREKETPATKAQFAKAEKELITELQKLSTCLKQEFDAEKVKSLRYVWGRIIMQVLKKSKLHRYTLTSQKMYDLFMDPKNKGTKGMIGRKNDLKRLVKLSHEIVELTEQFDEGNVHWGLLVK